MKMLSIISAATVFAFAASAAQAQQQTALACKDVTAATKPADGGFKRMGIRAPKASVNGARVTVMNVQIFAPADQARLDSNMPEPKIKKVWLCNPNQISVTAAVDPQPDFDATEIAVPETLPKGTKIQVCSKSVGCADGTFTDFDSWVTLAVGSAAPASKVTGKYK